MPEHHVTDSVQPHDGDCKQPGLPGELRCNATGLKLEASQVRHIAVELAQRLHQQPGVPADRSHMLSGQSTLPASGHGCTCNEWLLLPHSISVWHPVLVTSSSHVACHTSTNCATPPHRCERSSSHACDAQGSWSQMTALYTFAHASAPSRDSSLHPCPPSARFQVQQTLLSLPAHRLTTAAYCCEGRPSSSRKAMTGRRSSYTSR